MLTASRLGRAVTVGPMKRFVAAMPAGYGYSHWRAAGLRLPARCRQRRAGAQGRRPTRRRRRLACPASQHADPGRAGARPVLRSIWSTGAYVRAYCTLMVPRINAACPGKLQKNVYGPPSLILLTAKITEVVLPPPISSVFATTRASSALRYPPATPAETPSPATPCTSASLLITTLWPITSTASWPVCLRVIL